MQKCNLGVFIKIWPFSYFVMLETMILIRAINVFLKNVLKKCKKVSQIPNKYLLKMNVNL